MEFHVLTVVKISPEPINKMYMFIKCYTIIVIFLPHWVWRQQASSIFKWASNPNSDGLAWEIPTADSPSPSKFLPPSALQLEIVKTNNLCVFCTSRGGGGVMLWRSGYKLSATVKGMRMKFYKWGPLTKIFLKEGKEERNNHLDCSVELPTSILAE